MNRMSTLLVAGVSSQTQPQVQDTAVSDSVGRALEQLGESVSETGQLLIEGEWSAVGTRLAALASDMLESFVPNLISALFVGIVFYVLFLVVHRIAKRLLQRSRVGAGLEALLMRTLNVVGLGFILILALSQLGMNVTALVTGLGIAGIALGFAAKDTLENFIAGVTILLDRPFAIGDYIEIDGTYGRVGEITLRSTRIRTLGNRTLVVPNLLMITRSLQNFSDPARATGLRVDIPFGIAYKERPAEARKVVLAAIRGDERVREDPPPDVVVTGLSESSVDMRLRLYVKNPGDEHPVRFEYLERVREALRDAGIEIPFPHLQLFIDEARALTSEEAAPLRVVVAGEDERSAS